MSPFQFRRIKYFDRINKIKNLEFKISDKEVLVILPYSNFRPNEQIIFIDPAKRQRRQERDKEF